MLKHYNIYIYGKVQGVGFRYFVYRTATDSGVHGFVKNLPDGSVYAEAEAESDILELFVLQCKKGSTRSRVDKITFTESNTSNFVDFKIK